jgi:HYDIN/CFA65/VesB family protein
MGGRTVKSAMRTSICSKTPTRIISLSGPVAFGNVEVGSSKTATLTVSNTGNSTLTFTSIGGGFAETTVTPPTSGTIAAGGSRDLIFRFAPLSAGGRTATITINADHMSGNNATSMTGTGVATAPPSAAGTWRGQAVSTSCRDEGAAAAVNYCKNVPTHNGPVVLTLVQFVGGNVAGSIDIAGYPVNSATGNLTGDRLQINGSGNAGAFDYEYRNWNSTISGSSMTGTFTWLLSLKSGGFVQYNMMLVNVVK